MTNDTIDVEDIDDDAIDVRDVPSIISRLQGGLNFLLCQSSAGTVDLWHRSVTHSVIETVIVEILIYLANSGYFSPLNVSPKL